MNRTRLQPLDAQAPGVVASLLRYWRSSLLIVLVAGVVVFGISLVLPKQYEAKAGIELVDPDDQAVFRPGGKLPEDLDRHTAQEISTIKGVDVREATAEKIGAEPNDVKGDYSASIGSTSGEIVITARAGTAEAAAALANAVTEGYRDVAKEKISKRATADLASIEKEAKELDTSIAALKNKPNKTPEEEFQLGMDETQRRALAGVQQEIKVNSTALGNGVEGVDRASPPESPVEPVPLRNAGVAALLALLVAGAVAWFRADRNRAAEDSSTPAAVLEAPLLGGIPTLDRGADMAALQDGSSAASEAYQVITASLQHVFRWGVLLVTSAGRGDGKTVSAASIAGTAARDGTRVVLIDADVRAATLTARLIGASERRSIGLTDVAEGRVGLDDAVRFLRLSDDVTLPFLPAGSAVDDAGSLYRVAPMAQILQQLRESYDLVIVDCAAMLAVADAASLAVHADGILAVVSRATPIATLDAVRQRLDLVDAPLVGYVFTRDDVTSQPYLTGPAVPAHVGGRRRGAPAGPVAPAWPQQGLPTNGKATGNGSSDNDDFWNRTQPAPTSKSNGHAAYERPLWEVDLGAAQQTGEFPPAGRPQRRPGGPDQR